MLKSLILYLLCHYEYSLWQECRSDHTWSIVCGFCKIRLALV